MCGAVAVYGKVLACAAVMWVAGQEAVEGEMDEVGEARSDGVEGGSGDGVAEGRNDGAEKVGGW